MNLTPVFNQYLRRMAIPTPELKFDESKSTVSYRWKVDEPAFNRGSRRKERQLADHHATAEWQTMRTSLKLKKGEFEVARDLYHINVAKA